MDFFPPTLTFQLLIHRDGNIECNREINFQRLLTFEQNSGNLNTFYYTKISFFTIHLKSIKNIENLKLR